MPAAMIRAAGIIFFTKDDEILLLLRGSSGDHSKEWCFPGGKLGDGETPEQAAVREAQEEIGRCPRGKRLLLVKTKAPANPVPIPVSGDGAVIETPLPADDVEFTTFVQFIDEPFDVKLDENEHVLSMWCNVDDLPKGMHPGAELAIRRLRGTELDVARMMAADEIEGPQKIGATWLFNMRITGTGVSFRQDLNEYAYRPSEQYLTRYFLDRCNGLPVIIEHPKDDLTTDEYRERNIGAVFLPYIRGDEVWGVTKVFDDVAAKLMIEKKLSTSPAVFFRGNTNTTLQLSEADGGGTLLIEGKPSILEHLAICPLGVWDKGGPPSGFDHRSKSMDEEEKKSLFGMLDAIGKRMDSMDKRMDSIQSKEGDDKPGDEVVGKPKTEATDGKSEKRDDKRKDSDGDDDRKDRKDATDGGDEKDKEKDSGDKKDSADGENEKDKKESEAAEKQAAAAQKEEAERKDQARKDAAMVAENEELKKRIGHIESMMNGSNRKDFAEAQLRAEPAYTARGDSAPAPMISESLIDYRIRLAKPHQKSSPTWKDVELGKLTEPTAFALAEGQIYKDSVASAHSPDSVGEGMLREVKVAGDAGRTITKFVGRPRSWMGAFSTEPNVVSHIEKNPTI